MRELSKAMDTSPTGFHMWLMGGRVNESQAKDLKRFMKLVRDNWAGGPEENRKALMSGPYQKWMKKIHK